MMRRQIAHLRRRYGLTETQARLLADLHFGGGGHG